MIPIENELEKRSMLSKEKYMEIVSDIFFLNEKYYSFDMTNRYYDDDELSLFKNKIVFRTRELSNDIIMTLKITQEDESSIEINEVIDNRQLQALINNGEIPYGNVRLKLIELRIDFSNIHFKGLNKVRRIETYKDDSTICLDKVVINDNETYDIEVESSSLEKASEIIKEYSEKYNFEITKDYESKALRTLKNGD